MLHREVARIAAGVRKLPRSAASARDDRFLSDRSAAARTAVEQSRALPMVSVIVATRDRPAHLARALASFLGLRYPRFEVIVVDQGDASQTRDIIEHAHAASGAHWQIRSGEAWRPSDEPREVVYASSIADVRHIPSTQRGVSRGRNLGAVHARGEVLSFTDDDCTVDANWLLRIGRAFAADHRLHVLCGAVHATPHDAKRFHVPVFAPGRSYNVHRLSLFALWPWQLGLGANLAVWRSTFFALGGFDTRLGSGAAIASGEDVDLIYRAVRELCGVRVDAANVVTHWGARPHHTGDARRLQGDSWRGAGGCCGVLVRDGDLLGLLLLARRFASLAVGWSLALVRGDPSPQPRLARLVLAGFIHGVRLARVKVAGSYHYPLAAHPSVD